MPGNVQTVHIPLMANQTSKTRLEHSFTSDVSRVLARNVKVTVVEQSSAAEAILVGKIIRYSHRAVAYNKNDDISKYRSTMVVEAELVINDQKRQSLWKKTISWSTDYSADDNKMNQSVAEDEAIEELSSRLAEELYDLLLNDF